MMDYQWLYTFLGCVLGLIAAIHRVPKMAGTLGRFHKSALGGLYQSFAGETTAFNGNAIRFVLFSARILLVGMICAVTAITCGIVFVQACVYPKPDVWTVALRAISFFGYACSSYMILVLRDLFAFLDQQLSGQGGDGEAGKGDK